jgi:hypothetical protein
VTTRSPLLTAALARVGTGTAWGRVLQGGPVIIRHPVKGYTGPVAGPIRLHFVDGRAEATNLKASTRKALEEADFIVESPREAAKDDTGKNIDGP